MCGGDAHRLSSACPKRGAIEQSKKERDAAIHKEDADVPLQRFHSHALARKLAMATKRDNGRVVDADYTQRHAINAWRRKRLERPETTYRERPVTFSVANAASVRTRVQNCSIAARRGRRPDRRTPVQRMTKSGERMVVGLLSTWVGRSCE